MTFPRGTYLHHVKHSVAFGLGLDETDLVIPGLPGEDYNEETMTIQVLGGKVKADRLSVELAGFPNVQVASFKQGDFLRAAQRSVTRRLGEAHLVFTGGASGGAEDVMIARPCTSMRPFSAQAETVRPVSGDELLVPAGFPCAAAYLLLAFRLGCEPGQIRLLLGTEPFLGRANDSIEHLDITAVVTGLPLYEEPLTLSWPAQRLF